jgi:hypothetical protein
MYVCMYVRMYVCMYRYISHTVTDQTLPQNWCMLYIYIIHIHISGCMRYTYMRTHSVENTLYIYLAVCDIHICRRRLWMCVCMCVCVCVCVRACVCLAVCDVHMRMYASVKFGSCLTLHKVYIYVCIKMIYIYMKNHIYTYVYASKKFGSCLTLHKTPV